MARKRNIPKINLQTFKPITRVVSRWLASGYVGFALMGGAVSLAAVWTFFSTSKAPQQLSLADFQKSAPQNSEPIPPGGALIPPVDIMTYFHPAWQTDSVKVSGNEAIRYNDLFVTEEKLRNILVDSENRVESEFRVPAPLKERVFFWLRVYTTLNKHARIIHDRSNPGIVYGTLDYSPLFAAIKDRVHADIYRRRIEKQIVAEIKNRVLEAAGVTKTQLLAPWEKAELRNFLSRIGALDKGRIYSFVSRIRTQSGQRDEFLAALRRSEKLLPYIEGVLRNYSLPVALARLPFVESSFNPKAASKVGAVGIWQFMPETARQMIHPTDRARWAEPLAQTRAAAKVLIIFRSLLPDWSTAITAYNSGVGRLQRMVRTYHAQDISKIIESNERTLGFAGKNFYAQFLTANLVEAYREQLFIELSDDDQAVHVAFRPVKSFNQRFRELN